MHEAAAALSARLLELSEGREDKPVAVFVPVRPKEKQPLVKHADGQWTYAKSQSYIKCTRHTDYRIGILLYGLFVIDFDEHALYTDWLAQFPELERAPAEMTRKGVHVYFRRCDAVEAAGLTDGPLMNPDKPGAKANIDRKTITSTGSGGLLVCAPTPNYAWLPGRSLLELDPPTMSPLLLQHIERFSARGEKRRGSAAGASGPDKTAKQKKTCAAPENDFEVLLDLLDFPREQYTMYQMGCSEQWGHVDTFLARPDRDYACHMCGDLHTNNISGKIKQLHGSYILQANHIRKKENPKCQKTHTIAAANAEAYRNRFSKRPQLGAAEATAVVGAIRWGQNADPTEAHVWELRTPEPGFVAHALRLPGDDWRLLVQSEDGAAAWYRDTLFPGLFYEYLDGKAYWTPAATNSAAAKKPTLFSF